MNTNALKSFAQGARRKLLEQVGAKMEYVLTMDSSLLREQAPQVKKLTDEINASSKDQVIDKVAYTWFNRLMALRFMDANDYQPIGMRVLTPQEGYSLPEILDEAKKGNIPEELPVNQQHIYDLLDGKISNANAQNEAFKELLVGSCNHLNSIFPFLFERINDFAELLMPDDLTSEFSIVHDVVAGMKAEDCQEVEVIGWLYQFYISEKKDEVFAKKGKVEADEIPAATQLFTPRWIVEYMVQNTVGKLWLQNKPESGLKAHMPYYIESPSSESAHYLKVNSVEELTLLDQACGSGHILVYGFELLSKIYEEEGYNPSEIPQLIIENNLFGFEIDGRAAQLAGLALMMKARSYHRRVFRKQLQPNILQYKDLRLADEEIENFCVLAKMNLTDELAFDLSCMQQATNLGSLILPQSSRADLEQYLSQITAYAPGNDAFVQYQQQQLLQTIEQLLLLSQKYHCIVDNPPYMGAGNMNKHLADFVKKHYPISKVDLMACFMEAGSRMLLDKGFLGMINQHSWMFLSSYEKLRESLIDTTVFDTLLHLGPRTFPEIGGEVVQNASFTFWNTTAEAQGKYLRLVDDGSTELKRENTLEAIQNPGCGWFYITNQNRFRNIPGSPIAYWASDSYYNSFKANEKVGDQARPRTGLNTGDNQKYLKYWNEISFDVINFNSHSVSDALKSRSKWFPYNKGGSFRKWFGNNEYVVNYFNDGEEIKDYAVVRNKGKHWSRFIQNTDWFYKPGLTWSFINTNNFGVRIKTHGFVFDVQGTSSFPVEQDIYYYAGLLCSKVAYSILQLLNPTLSFQAGNIASVPLIRGQHNLITSLALGSFNISKKEWDSRETSWDFTVNELIKQEASSLAEAYELYCTHWQEQFIQLHQNEEELNKQFIGIYGLQEELTPDVALKDITILKDELDQKALTKISDSFTAGWQLQNGEWQLPNKDAYSNLQLPFDQTEIVKQLISYGVGCMFGRYSLDKKGLILAKQGETLSDYIAKIQSEELGVKDEADISFMPDDDNIIPVLDDEWFEDDIVGRFYEFLKVTFGEASFEKNLAFVEDSLGKDIRKFFVKDFYADHVKRYKKRPIYWMFSSPKGSFNVLVYLHRYNPDTLNQVLTNYLREYQEKLKTRIEDLEHIILSGSAGEQTKAAKEKDKINMVLLELKDYERDVLYPLATERIKIDLDDGVLVNYNKFGQAIKPVAGLNDKKTKEKVRKFDWIDTSEII